MGSAFVCFLFYQQEHVTHGRSSMRIATCFHFAMSWINEWTTLWLNHINDFTVSSKHLKHSMHLLCSAVTECMLVNHMPVNITWRCHSIFTTLWCLLQYKWHICTFVSELQSPSFSGPYLRKMNDLNIYVLNVIFKYISHYTFSKDWLLLKLCTQ